MHLPLGHGFIGFLNRKIELFFFTWGAIFGNNFGGKRKNRRKPKKMFVWGGGSKELNNE